MSTLLVVVEAGSLSAASQRLGIPLTTISRRLSDLEGHLKTRLLLRSSRRVTLTDAGVAYIQACRRILEEIKEGLARALDALALLMADPERRTRRWKPIAADSASAFHSPKSSA